MEPGLNVPNHLGLRAGIHAALGHLTGAPVNDFVPLRLGVRVHGAIEAGNEFAGQMGAGQTSSALSPGGEGRATFCAKGATLNR